MTDESKTDPKRPQINVRLEPADREALQRVAEALGVDVSLSEALRSLPRVYQEREDIMRAALEPLRGRLTIGDVDLCIDVSNSAWHLREAGAGWIGTGLLASVADTAEGIHGGSPKRILREVGKAGPAAAMALDLWCEMLWRRVGSNDEHVVWRRERAWLSTRGE